MKYKYHAAEIERRVEGSKNRGLIKIVVKVKKSVDNGLTRCPIGNDLEGWGLLPVSNGKPTEQTKSPTAPRDEAERKVLLKSHESPWKRYQDWQRLKVSCKLARNL